MSFDIPVYIVIVVSVVWGILSWWAGD